MSGEKCIERICVCCEKPFLARPEQIRQGRGKYCSQTCACASRSCRPLAERFWEKVAKRDDDACWLWTANQDARGYGRFAVSRCNIRLSHRVAWELLNGTIPEGLRVLHTCDNPPCVNPDHLFVGTAKENTRDMVRKWRHAHGERHGHATLTDEIVLEMRRLRSEEGLSYAEIGRRVGRLGGTVHKICTRQRWVHI